MSSPGPSIVGCDAQTSRSLQRTLGIYRAGASDPTTRLTPSSFLRATFTPEGPATLVLRWDRDPAPPDDAGLIAEAWGPGADWMLARIDAITGALDRPPTFLDAHPAVERALRTRRVVRIGASGDLYHQLLPTIIGQRITAGEALNRWRRLCLELGDPAPGPPDLVDGLRLPPSPETLLVQPLWWFHPLGIEQKRARPLVEVARHASKLWGWAALGPHVAADKLALIPGIGPWTVGSVIGPALGDPDAVPVGDYHFPNIVAWALAGEARADDDRMLELLEPYGGQRGRVLWHLVTTAGRAPSFGPRQRILPMSRF